MFKFKIKHNHKIFKNQHDTKIYLMIEKKNMHTHFLSVNKLESVVLREILNTYK